MRNLSRSAPLTGGGTISGDVIIEGSLGVNDDVTVNVNTTSSGTLLMLDADGDTTWQVTPSGQVGVGERSKANLTSKTAGANFLVEAKSIFELSGACTVIPGNVTINASGTSFKTDLKVGSAVRLETATPQHVIVRSIPSDTQFLTTADTVPAAGSTELSIKLTMPPDRIFEIAGPSGVKGFYADTGVGIHIAGTASPGILYIENPQDDIEDEDILGRIEFQAPEEDSGTDALLSGAAIWGVAEADFTASVNSTALVFGTNTSAFATERMRINASGNVGIGTTSPDDARLEVVNSGDAAVIISQSGSHAALSVTGTDGGGSDCVTFTSSQTTGVVFQVNDDAVTTGGLLQIASNSSSTGTRNLVKIRNDNIAATGATCFKIQQDSSGLGMDIHSAFTSASGAGAGLRLYSDDGAVMASGDRLGVIEFGGAEDTSNTITVGARIEAVTDAIWASGENGTDLVFYTGDGDVSSLGTIERLRLKASGEIDCSTSISFGATFRPFIKDSVASGTNPLYSFVGKEATGMSMRDTDTLNFITNSVTRLELDNNSRISLSNNQASNDDNTVFGYQAFNCSSDNGSNSNTIIGHLAAGTGTVSGAADNTAVGYFTLQDLTSGDNNVAVGSVAGANITSSTNNTLLGFGAGRTITTGADGTVAVGKNALTALTSGASNTAVGYVAGTALTVGGYNTVLGYNALFTEDVGARNTAIGYSALYAQNTAGGSEVITGNTAVGMDAGFQNVTGTNNVYLGHQAGTGISSKSHSGCVFVGKDAGKTAYTGDNNIAIGAYAMDDTDADTTVGASAHNIFMGTDSGGGTWVTAASNNNVAIGNNSMAGAMNGALNNTAVGNNAGAEITTADANVLIGAGVGDSITSGGSNAAVGYYTLSGLGTGGQNATLGAWAMYAASGAESNNVAIGYNALYAVNNTSANGTVAVGVDALKLLTSGTGNVAVGYQSLDATDDGARNTAVGYGSLSANCEDDNTAIGHQSLAASTGSDNVAIGVNSLYTATTQVECVAIGKDALKFLNNDAANGTVGIGYNALAALTSGAGNTAVGHLALDAATTDDYNTAVGHQALSAITGANNNFNTGVGYQAGTALVTGTHNTLIGAGAGAAFGVDENSNVCVGSQTMVSFDEGTNGHIDYNIAIGRDAFSGADLGTGSTSVIGNIAIGLEALNSTGTNAQTGTIAIGHQVLTNITTGGENTVIGYQGMIAADGAEADNVCIGYAAMVSVNHDDADRNVVVGRSAGQGGTGAMADCVVVGYGAMNNTASNAQTGTVAIGRSSLTALTSGQKNVAIGFQAQFETTIGDSNIAIGYEAMMESGAFQNNDNIAIGRDAMGGDWTSASVKNVAIGTGTMGGAMGGTYDNVAVGYLALTSLVGGDGNVAIGSNTMDSITGGGYNIAIGQSAYQATSAGTQTVAIGHQALYTADSDDNDGSVAVGYQAGYTQNATAGAQFAAASVYIGHSAGKLITTGAGNLAIGYHALAQHTTGARNIAIGYGAMDGTGEDDADISTDNIFIGYDAGGGSWDDGADSTDDSNFNVGVGNYCMDAAMDGALNNTALGYNTLTALTSGGSNVAVGIAAGAAITTGSENTIVGRYSGDAISTTGGNTLVGSTAGGSLTGAYNTLLGWNAGNALVNASGNTMIGWAEGSGTTVADEIVIACGQAAELAGQGTETCTIGKASDYITVDFGENATWSHSSDIRIKKNIENSKLGLSFINDLRPVTFNKKAPNEYPKEFSQYDANQTERKNPDKKHYGFIAQEVKEAMDKAGHSEFPAWSEGNDGMQKLGEAEFITPLIKAVQELSAQVESLKEQLNNK